MNCEMQSLDEAAKPGSGSACSQFRFFGREGFVLGYLLFALALLSMLIAASGKLIGTQDNAKWIAMAKDKLEDQANLIMTQITTCAMLNTVASETEIAASYPNGVNVTVSSLICPGTSATIWDGSSGAFMPPVVSGFSDWRYFKFSSGTSATIYFYTTAGDGIGSKVLRRVADRLGTSQTSLTQTSFPNDTLRVVVMDTD